MPTYEYRCTKCKKKFELRQRITEDPVKKCIHCGGKPERLISSGVGLIFKGSGFYATDYKKSGETKKAKPEAAPACSAPCDSCPAKASNKGPASSKKSTDSHKSVVK
jgi:putative FmdB family regulatory protein